MSGNVYPAGTCAIVHLICAAHIVAIPAEDMHIFNYMQIIFTIADALYMYNAHRSKWFES